VKTRDEVSSEKVRGGFYSPDRLVDFCLDRIDELMPTKQDLRVLEPSAGDGAFIRGLSRRPTSLRVGDFVGVEVLQSEAEKSKHWIRQAPFSGRIHTCNFIPWATRSRQEFDVAVGNPPFVRFQFTNATHKREADDLAAMLGVSFRGVSNLWLPVFIGALDRLREGGAFAFIVPAESLTGVSASTVRRWLMANTDELQLDMFPPGSFPGVLQEVVVMSGLRRAEPRVGAGTLRIREHDTAGRASTWSHRVDPDQETWTRFLLSPKQLAALEAAQALPMVRRLSDVAKFEVACVTGANEFFSVDADTMKAQKLEAWGTPMLPRARHARGLIYDQSDHVATQAEGAKAWLLDFSDDRPDPTRRARAARYLAEGERAGLHLRYKTSIREPWYRVPHVRPGRLMLSKRSHRFPRLILNRAEVVTTDTIYRGWMKPGFKRQAPDLVAGFHNSLTLLTAEVEGRSFGGGVLELVPSEISRLLVALPAGFADELPRLHAAAKDMSEFDGEVLIEETDLLLRKYEPGLTDDMAETLHEARGVLLQRRLDRM